jgi:hypothetical protein
MKDRDRGRRVVEDGVTLIEEEVHGKGGLSGLAIKAGYRTVKAIKPGIIHEALGQLLPDFAPAIDPHYVKAVAAGDVRKYFTAHAEEIAQSLLGVTDAKGARAKNRVIKKAYDSLRPQAIKHTAEAMPRLADLIQKHVK